MTRKASVKAVASQFSFGYVTHSRYQVSILPLFKKHEDDEL